MNGLKRMDLQRLNNMFDKIKAGDIVKVKHRVGGSEFEFIRIRECFFDRNVPFGKGYEAKYVQERFEILK